jgi:NADPH2:quinone reductase
VIATASSAEKRALALELGADVAIDPAADGLRDRVVEANGGEPVDVVLEMTGGRVTDASLSALAPFGRLVFYGAAARAMPRPVDPVALMAASRAVVGFWLAHCFTRPHLLALALDELLGLVASGELRPVVGGEYPLSDARRAHEDLRARATVGKLVLDPAH